MQYRLLYNITGVIATELRIFVFIVAMYKNEIKIRIMLDFFGVI